MKKNNITSLALTVALGGFLMGFDASVISGVVGFVETQFELTKLQLGFAVSCLTLTSTLSMMVAGPLSDLFGRKKVLVVAALLFFISAVYSALSPGFVHLVIARMIGGFGVGAALIVPPMYIAEIAPPKIRGRLVSFNQLNIVVGLSVAFFTNYIILQLGKSDASWAQSFMFDEHNWRWMLSLEAIPAILYFSFLFFIPESPRWLIMQGRKEEARNVLASITTSAEADETIRVVTDAIKSDSSKEKVPLGELFKPALRLVLTIGIIIAVLQQITGINAVFFYAPMIFEQTGIGTDAAFIQAIIIGLTNLVFTVLAILFVDRLGRKPLLAFGLVGIVLSMFVLSGSFKSAEYKLDENAIAKIELIEGCENIGLIQGKVYESDLQFKRALTETIGADAYREHGKPILNTAITINSWLVLIGIIGFVASFAISLGPVMWILFSEIFPDRLRGVAISFVGFINSAISFMVQQVFPWELENMGSTATFLIFGLFAVVGLVLILKYLPETKGKSLEELESILINKK